MKATIIQSRILEHGKKLLRIFPNAIERDPVKLCKKLRRIETALSRIATQYCNGDINDDEIDSESERLMSQVQQLLNVPVLGAKWQSIFFNRDPRGYALKIDDKFMREAKLNLHQDLGGYGIIAPDLS